MLRSDFVNQLTQLFVMCKNNNLNSQQLAEEVVAFIDYRNFQAPEAWLHYKTDKIIALPPNYHEIEFIDGECVNRWEDET